MTSSGDSEEQRKREERKKIRENLETCNSELKKHSDAQKALVTTQLSALSDEVDEIIKRQKERNDNIDSDLKTQKERQNTIESDLEKLKRSVELRLGDFDKQLKDCIRRQEEDFPRQLKDCIRRQEFDEKMKDFNDLRPKLEHLIRHHTELESKFEKQIDLERSSRETELEALKRDLKARTEDWRVQYAEIEKLSREATKLSERLNPLDPRLANLEEQYQQHAKALQSARHAQEELKAHHDEQKSVQVAQDTRLKILDEKFLNLFEEHRQNYTKVVHDHTERQNSRIDSVQSLLQCGQDELRSRFDRYHQDHVSHAEEQNKKIESAQSTHHQRLHELEAKIMNSLEQHRQQHALSQDEIRSRLDRYHQDQVSHADEQNKKMEAAQASTHQGLKELDAKFLSSLEDHRQQHALSRDEIRSRLDRCHQDQVGHAEEQSKRMESVQERLKELDAKFLSSLEDHRQQHALSQDEIRSRLDRYHQDQVGHADEQNKKMEAAQASTHQGLKELDAKFLSSLEDHCQQHALSQDEIRSRLDRCHQDHVSHAEEQSKRMESVQERLKELDAKFLNSLEEHCQRHEVALRSAQSSHDQKVNHLLEDLKAHHDEQKSTQAAQDTRLKILDEKFVNLFEEHRQNHTKVLQDHNERQERVQAELRSCFDLYHQEQAKTIQSHADEQKSAQATQVTRLSELDEKFVKLFEEHRQIHTKVLEDHHKTQNSNIDELRSSLDQNLQDHEKTLQLHDEHNRKTASAQVDQNQRLHDLDEKCNALTTRLENLHEQMNITMQQELQAQLEQVGHLQQSLIDLGLSVDKGHQEWASDRQEWASESRKLWTALHAHSHEAKEVPSTPRSAVVLQSTRSMQSLSVNTSSPTPSLAASKPIISSVAPVQIQSRSPSPPPPPSRSVAAKSNVLRYAATSPAPASCANSTPRPSTASVSPAPSGPPIVPIVPIVRNSLSTASLQANSTVSTTASRLTTTTSLSPSPVNAPAITPNTHGHTPRRFFHEMNASSYFDAAKFDVARQVSKHSRTEIGRVIYNDAPTNCGQCGREFPGHALECPHCPKPNNRRFDHDIFEHAPSLAREKTYPKGNRTPPYRNEARGP